jgi:molybdopterin molybdotransferase
MPTFEEARDLILRNVFPLGAERVSLTEAWGRILAEDAAAPWDLPREDNTAMDGYAVRSADCAGPAVLRVAGYNPAGAAGAPRVDGGCAIRIMTGAPIPEGADAVVPLEDAEEAGDSIRTREPVRPGAHIRCRGEDVKAGQKVIAAGTALRPPEIGMLASLGKVFVAVHRRVRVAVLSTGDELVEPGEPLLPGAVVNSNSLSLAAAIREAGGVPVLTGIARDDRESLRRKLADGLAAADALVTSAGVSAGDKDLVRDVLSELSVREIFWRVSIRPGSPVAFGLREAKPVFALPGNPVSSMVTFEVFVRPALRKMMGDAVPVRPPVKAVLAEPVRKKAGRVLFLRVRIGLENGEIVARSAGDQHTGILRTMVASDGLAVLPEDRTAFEAGEKVDVHLLYRR